jgi:hypothetical protein
VVAALRILPPAAYSSYPQIDNTYSWDELVRATNLRTDLIRNINYQGGTLADHPPHERMYSRSLGFCIENMSPTSILTFGVMAWSGEGKRRHLFRTNLHGGITMETRRYEDSPVPLSVEMSWFG